METKLVEQITEMLDKFQIQYVIGILQSMKAGLKLESQNLI